MAGLAVGLFALVINLLTVWYYGFDGLYGQDPYSYYAHAVELASRQSLFHQWQWEAAPRILYWPFGYPALVAIFFSITGATAGVAQLVSLISWAATVGLITSVGQTLFGTRAGIIAGGLVALSAWGRQSAISVMADAPALFWTMLAVWLGLKCWQDKGGIRAGWWLVGAGVALGIGGITRYSVLFGGPLLLVLGYRASKKSGRPRYWLMWTLAVVAIVGLIYLPQFLINLAYPDRFWSNSWFADWRLGNLFGREFLTRDGLGSYALPNIVFYAAFPLVNLRFLTPVLLPLIGLGIATLWQKRAKLEGLLLFNWWIWPVVLMSGIPYQSERYSLTMLPPLALLGGLGADWLWQLGWVQKIRWRQATVIGGLAIILLAEGIISQRHLAIFVEAKQANLGIVRTVEASVPSDATVITFDVSLTFDHYTRLAVRDLFFLSPDSVNALTQQNKPVYLLADPQKMQQQWSGTPTGRAFEAARSLADSSPPVKIGTYWLWRLRA